MKFFCAVLAMALLFTPSDAVDIALSHDKVERAESFRYYSEIYVAIICEPIYLRSENISICHNIEREIENASGVNANVIIDLHAYSLIKRLNSKNGLEREQLVKQVLAIFASRRKNEDS